MAFAEVLENRDAARVVVGRVLCPDGLASDRVDRRPAAQARESRTIAPAVLPHLNAVPTRNRRRKSPVGLNHPVGLLSMATTSDLWAHGMSPNASAASDSKRKWRAWNPSVSDVTTLKDPATVPISAMEMGGSARSSGVDVMDHCCGLPGQSSCHEPVAKRRLARKTTIRPRPWRPVGPTRRFLVSTSEPPWLRLPSASHALYCARDSLRAATSVSSASAEARVAMSWQTRQAPVTTSCETTATALKANRAAALNFLCQTVHTLCCMSENGEWRPCKSMTDCAIDRTLDNLRVKTCDRFGCILGKLRRFRTSARRRSSGALQPNVGARPRTAWNCR